jgi:hypothetical protein
MFSWEIGRLEQGPIKPCRRRVRQAPHWQAIKKAGPACLFAQPGAAYLCEAADAAEAAEAADAADAADAAADALCLVFLGADAIAEADADAGADAIAEADADADADAAAKAELANREMSRAAKILDMLISFL